MASWDVIKPADTDLVRNFPAAHRTDKTTLRDQLQVEHDVLDVAGTATGKHKLPYVVLASRPAAALAGHIVVVSDKKRISVDTGAAYDEFPFAVGTKIIFPQAAAPVGWTRVVDAANTDATIILRQNAEVPGAGGTWTVGGLSSAAHVLTTAEMPGHRHAMVSGDGLAGSGPSGLMAPGTVNVGDDINAMQFTGGGGGHSHSVSQNGTWRPKHVDCIVAQKE